MSRPKIISGFPGVGKSQLYTRAIALGNRVCDSDSSYFDKRYFPENYIDHIREKITTNHSVLVSSHKVVRDAMVNEGFLFNLVYPSLVCKDEYLERYKNRGSAPEFIKMMTEKWEEFVHSCATQPGCHHVVLGPGEFIPPIDSPKYVIL